MPARRVVHRDGHAWVFGVGSRGLDWAGPASGPAPPTPQCATIMPAGSSRAGTCFPGQLWCGPEHAGGGVAHGADCDEDDHAPPPVV